MLALRRQREGPMRRRKNDIATTYEVAAHAQPPKWLRVFNPRAYYAELRVNVLDEALALERKRHAAERPKADTMRKVDYKNG
jgi:hypothetical protein